MYKSPIEIKLNDFVSDVIEKEDEYIVKCVQQVGVNVDKDELIKALRYDRGQYEKGWNDRDNEVVRCKDCKYWKGENEFCGLLGGPNDYCSWGRRKDGKTN